MFVDDNIDNLVKSWEKASTILFQWFYHDLLKSNPGKCHLPISSHKSLTVKIGKHETEKKWVQEITRRLIRLQAELWWTYGGKLNAIARIARFIGLSKRRILKSVLMNFQFYYCVPQTKNNTKINRLHEKCLCIIYNNKR